MKYRLVCSSCGSLVEREPAYLCPKCGGILDIRYPDCDGAPAPNSLLAGVFKYESRLPVEGGDDVSLREGDTPLVRSVKSVSCGRLKNLYFKLEGDNPTASFKDRGIAVGVAAAIKFGAEKLVIASSGNASASAAAYAARCDIPLVALVPENTPPGKTGQAALHGAKIMRVPGVYSDAYALCRTMAEKHGWFDLTTTFVNPYVREGYKTIGYEIFAQLGRVPDWIVMPVGAGPILAATYRAFEEIGAGMPKLCCVQAAACGPISKAFLENEDRVGECFDPKPTLASGINDSLRGYTQDGDYTLKCMRASGGTALLLDEEEIALSVRLLASQGVCAEPAAAVGAVAAEKLSARGDIRPEDTIVVLVTGHGLKNLISLGGETPLVKTEDDCLKVMEE